MQPSRQNSRGPELFSTFKRQQLMHHTTVIISIIWAMAFVVAAYNLPPQLDQACEQPFKLAGTLMFGITIFVPIMISTDACNRMKEAATALEIRPETPNLRKPLIFERRLSL